MNAKTLLTVAVVALLAAGTFAIAQAPAPAKPAPLDPRIDKVLEQNEQILKNQAEILKGIADIKIQVQQLRWRSS